MRICDLLISQRLRKCEWACGCSGGDGGRRDGVRGLLLLLLLPPLLLPLLLLLLSALSRGWRFVSGS